MAFCPNCGSSADGRFCAKCGATIGSAPPQSETPGAAYTPSTTAPGLPENAASALCYALGLITGILFLVLAPYNANPRVRFHAFQSIFLHVSMIAIYIGVWMLIVILPTALVILLGLLQMVAGLGFVVLWLFLMWKSYEGQRIELPIIGPLAAGQAAQPR